MTIVTGSRDRLIAFTIANLPDSLEDRLLILTDILVLLEPKHPMHERINNMLTYLQSHADQQLEFPNLFPWKSEKPKLVLPMGNNS